jgi:hypothetical protein
LTIVTAASSVTRVTRAEVAVSLGDGRGGSMH